MAPRTKAEEAEERGGQVGAVARRPVTVPASARADTGNILAAASAAPDPFAGKTKAQIRVMQRQLGFTGRDVDGIAGPKTRAAWAAAQSSVSVPDVPAIPVTQTPAAVAAAPAAPVDVDSTIRERFPALAAFMAIPEIGTILRDAVKEGWPPEKLSARVQATEWWRTTPAKTRSWMGLQALDPATAQRQVEEHKVKLDQFRRAYLVPMSDETLAKWAEDDLAGRVPADGFLNYAKEQAKSLFPSLAGAIDRGITVEQYVAPYREIAARTLEVSPDSIDFMDHRWSRALVNPTPTGERTAMSLSDWQTTLRSDPTYGYDRTTQARQQAAEFAEKLARTFGKVA